MIRIQREYDMYVDWGTSGGGENKPKEPIIEIVYEKIANPEWIDVEEELPNPGVDVWVYSQKTKQSGRAHLMSDGEKQKQSSIRKQIDGNYEGNWWYDTEMFFPSNDITHWMELPKPPKI